RMHHAGLSNVDPMGAAVSRFLKALRSGRVLLMDGAMGTELQRAGLRDGENGATWNLLHPERVEAVHRAHVRAGADAVLTNTFLINANSYNAQLWAADVIPAYPEGWCEALARTGRGDHFRLAAVGPVSGRARREFDNLNEFAAPPPRLPQRLRSPRQGAPGPGRGPGRNVLHAPRPVRHAVPSAL